MFEKITLFTWCILPSSITVCCQCNSLLASVICLWPQPLRQHLVYQTYLYIAHIKYARPDDRRQSYMGNATAQLGSHLSSVICVLGPAMSWLVALDKSPPPPASGLGHDQRCKYYWISIDLSGCISNCHYRYIIRYHPTAFLPSGYRDTLWSWPVVSIALLSQYPLFNTLSK